MAVLFYNCVFRGFCAYFQAFNEIGVGGKTPVILYGGLTTVVKSPT